MSCKTHDIHDHKHGSTCGHQAIKHDDHVDYLHDNHLHHVHGDHIDEHAIAEGNANKATCTPEHKCDGHEGEHKHGPQCGHDAIPHGSHIDYLVKGHLHSPCKTHCDDHGMVAVA